MPAPSPVPTVSLHNSSLTPSERIVWDYLTNNGLSDIHAAAIMGNLKQEHNFRTDDVAGGLGIAQWLGGRRLALQQYVNYGSIEVQTQFLLDELYTTEYRALQALLSSTTLEDATIAFQNKFERCDPYLCRANQRIAYANYYLENH